MPNADLPDRVREIRVFVSSPGDVLAERQRLQRVTERLSGRFGEAAQFRCVRWEEHFYKSDATFQEQIEQAAACDIVVSVFWTRLGTELPADFGARLPDGRPYPSGTAYELLTALEAARSKSRPDVFVFRKTQDPKYPINNDAEAQVFDTQRKRLSAFWEEWFRNETGQFRAAFNSFGSTDEFEAQIEKLLLDWVTSKGVLGRNVRWRIDERGSPFRGLLPLEAGHAEIFFGRATEIERSRERLVDAAAELHPPFLLMLGASGSGKSSLARAGVIPRLVAPGAVDGVDVWRVAEVTIGRGDPDPLRNLATVLLGSEALPELAGAPNATADGIAGQLAQGGETAVGMVRWALQRVADQARTRDGYDRPVVVRLVLLLDQFESLFAATISMERRKVLVLAVDALVRSGPVWAIATMRSSDYTLLQADPTLLKLKEDGATLDLVPPDSVALAEVIRGPVEAAGLAFERDPTTRRTLDDILRSDAGGADALPLLQFTLQHLFEGRLVRDDVPTLTLDSYRALGGIEGAIAAEAERAVSALPGKAQERLPWLLRNLVGAGSRRTDATATLRDMVLVDSELASHTGAAELVDALVMARVVILHSGGETGPRRARLAHEAVLRGWQRARTFVASNA